MDYDAVELDNLHRQVIHSERTLGVSKSVSAKVRLASDLASLFTPRHVH